MCGIYEGMSGSYPCCPLSEKRRAKYSTRSVWLQTELDESYDMYLRIAPLARLVKALTQSKKAPHVAGVHFQVIPGGRINRHTDRG